MDDLVIEDSTIINNNIFNKKINQQIALYDLKNIVIKNCNFVNQLADTFFYLFDSNIGSL